MNLLFDKQINKYNTNYSSMIDAVLTAPDSPLRISTGLYANLGLGFRLFA